MAALPKTYKAFRRTVDTTPTTLEQTTEEIPATLSPNDVLIKIHAVSLNYRDVAMMHGKYTVEVIDHGVPASDCAAEVMKVGSNVHDFKVGDRVAPIFDNNNFDSTRDENSVLGGDIDGVLREYAVFHQDVLFHLPKHRFLVLLFLYLCLDGILPDKYTNSIFALVNKRSHLEKIG